MVLIRTAGLDNEEGMLALERLASPDPESRSQAFEGRRLIRIDGGFIALNYWKFREKDHTAAVRQRRYRAKKNARLKQGSVTRNATDVTRDEGVTSRNITHADADAEVEADQRPRSRARETLSGYGLMQQFGQLRSELLGGLPWALPASSDGKAETFAQRLSPQEHADVAPTMRLALDRIRARHDGWQDDRMLASPTFAFGCWMSRFTELREDLHKAAPKGQERKPSQDAAVAATNKGIARQRAQEARARQSWDEAEGPAKSSDIMADVMKGTRHG